MANSLNDLANEKARVARNIPSVREVSFYNVVKEIMKSRIRMTWYSDYFKKVKYTKSALPTDTYEGVVMSYIDLSAITDLGGFNDLYDFRTDLKHNSYIASPENQDYFIVDGDRLYLTSVFYSSTFYLTYWKDIVSVTTLSDDLEIPDRVFEKIKFPLADLISWFYAVDRRKTLDKQLIESKVALYDGSLFQPLWINL